MEYLLESPISLVETNSKFVAANGDGGLINNCRDH
jgi:hypothetical protein